jgi:uncharacterized protein YjiS (DUF1127 family)
MWPFDTYKTSWLGASSDPGRAYAGHRLSPTEYAMMARGESFATALIAVSRFIGEAVGRFIVAPFKAWRRQRVTYDELMALDDHMLRDLGITRGQVASVALIAATDKIRVRDMTISQIANRNDSNKAA